MVAFGWHMHSLFSLRFGLPYHPNINPIFVSFHLNRVQALTPETIEYLEAHGPIGCRDWTTVDLLLSAGVDAFFTGCLTTTVNAVFPELAEVEREQPDWSPSSTCPAPQVDRPSAPSTRSPTRTRATAGRPGAEGIRRRTSCSRDYQQRVPPDRHQPAALLPAGDLAGRPRRVPPAVRATSVSTACSA